MYKNHTLNINYREVKSKRVGKFYHAKFNFKKLECCINFRKVDFRVEIRANTVRITMLYWCIKPFCQTTTLILFFKEIFVYLAAPGLSWGVWDLVPQQGSNSGPLHWEQIVFVTGPPGNPHIPILDKQKMLSWLKIKKNFFNLLQGMLEKTHI